MDFRSTLKKNYEFKRLYNKGKTAVTPYMVVYALKSPKGCRRVGYTVSTKLGKAVVRNRIRRRLREIYRLNSDKLRSNVDMVIVARSRCVDGDYSKMERAFLHACAELGILRGDEQK